MDWIKEELKELWWKIRHPLSFDTRTKAIKEFEEGKKKAKKHKESKR